MKNLHNFRTKQNESERENWNGTTKIITNEYS